MADFLFARLVDCPGGSFGMADAAGGVGVFPTERLGIFGIGVDIAAEFTGQIGDGSEKCRGL